MRGYVRHPYSFALVMLVFLLIHTPSLAFEHKVALVMGNSKYTSVDPLPNPVRDAAAIASTLRELGFKVHEHLDMTRRDMRAALRAFTLDLGPGSIALVYYAGHGIQLGRENYLLPVDTDITAEYEIPDEGLSLNAVLRALRSANSSLGMVMLDACRNNPFERSLRSLSRSTGDSQGLVAMDAVRGTLLSYATQPGNIAVDGAGDHSPYTEALLSYLSEPGLSVQTMFNYVGLKVLETTHRQQEPWLSISPIPNFCFAGCERPHQLSMQDAFTAQRRILEFKRLMESRNLPGIEKIASLDPQQRQQLKHIFEVYDHLVIQIHDLDVHEQEGRVTAVAEIREMTNADGNLIQPAESWRTMPITLKKQGDTWEKISWN